MTIQSFWDWLENSWMPTLIILLGICLLLITGIKDVIKKQAPAPTPVVKTSIEKDFPILSKWVYDNSSKISMESAQRITKECQKRPHALLLLSIIKVESEFVPTATSNKGAIGLTQIMWEHHGKELIKKGIIKDRRDLYDIETNIMAGSSILEDMLKGHGDINKALTSYLGEKNPTYVHQILSNTVNLYILLGG